MSKLRVLMYHKVHETNCDFLTVTSSDLRRQLEFMLTHFTPIRLSQLIAFVAHKKPLPKNPILITFDDGFSNNYELAYPIFKELSIPFSVFPIAGFIGQTRLYDGKEQKFLTEAEMLEMSGLVEYGYHGLFHKNLNELDDTGILDEIKGAIDCFNKTKIHMQKAWAYTYGAYPKKDRKRFDQLKTILTNNGIELAFRIGNRLNSINIMDKFQIERLDIRGNQSFNRFKFKLLFGKFF